MKSHATARSSSSIGVEIQRAPLRLAPLAAGTRVTTRVNRPVRLSPARGRRLRRFVVRRQFLRAEFISRRAASIMARSQARRGIGNSARRKRTKLVTARVSDYGERPTAIYTPFSPARERKGGKCLFVRGDVLLSPWYRRSVSDDFGQRAGDRSSS